MNRKDLYSLPYNEFVRKVESQPGQISFAPIRAKQDLELTRRTISAATLIARSSGKNILSENSARELAAGSMDWGIGFEEGKIVFSVFEGNGASHRGMHTGGDEVNHQSTRELLKGYGRLVQPGMSVVVGNKAGDSLSVDRLGIERVAQENHAGLIINGDYSELVKQAKIKKRKLYIGNEPVDVVLGDGLIRRLPENDQRQYLGGDVDVIVANGSFLQFTSKEATYTAIKEIVESNSSLADMLSSLGFKPLNFDNVTRGDTESESNFLRSLARRVKTNIQDWGGAVLKWNDSSGSAGMRFFEDRTTPVNKIYSQIESGIDELRAKTKNPEVVYHPVTLQQMLNTSSWEHEGTLRNFDTRVYLTTQNLPTGEVEVIPAFFLFRITPEGSRAANLSVREDLGGGVDMSRGHGLYEYSLQRIGEQIGGVHDAQSLLTNLAAVSCVLYTQISNIYYNRSKV